jgi:hypothetical protein
VKQVKKSQILQTGPINGASVRENQMTDSDDNALCVVFHSPTSIPQKTEHQFPNNVGC